MTPHEIAAMLSEAEKRADMAHTLDTIHIGAVNVYYGKALEAERRYEKNT